ncbi:hypothetical protein Bbelb_351150 [Branchiostoma belcheri]|nr:hypothetical protein Bbelb_351150 [Branchiostoma belcheri]
MSSQTLSEPHGATPPNILPRQDVHKCRQKVVRGKDQTSAVQPLGNPDFGDCATGSVGLESADEADVPAVCWPVRRQKGPRDSADSRSQILLEKFTAGRISGLAHPVLGERDRCQPFLTTGSELARGQVAQGGSPAGAGEWNRPVTEFIKSPWSKR